MSQAAVPAQIGLDRHARRGIFKVVGMEVRRHVAPSDAAWMISTVSSPLTRRPEPPSAVAAHRDRAMCFDLKTHDPSAWGNGHDDGWTVVGKKERVEEARKDFRENFDEQIRKATRGDRRAV